MSRHGRIRYFGSYSPQHKEDKVIDKQVKKVDDQDNSGDLCKDNEEDRPKAEDRKQEKVEQKQRGEIGDAMQNRAEGQHQDKTESQNQDNARDRQQDNIKSLDGQQSIRRKRFYSEVKIDETLEEPTSPSKEINPPSTCCRENCSKDLDVDKVGQELKNEFCN